MSSTTARVLAGAERLDPIRSVLRRGSRPAWNLHLRGWGLPEARELAAEYLRHLDVAG